MRSLLLSLATAAALMSAVEASAAPRLVMHRTGGVAGVNDTMVIGARGVGTVTQNGGTPVRLRADQTRAARRALRAARFDTLDRVYAPKGTVADGFVYVLRHHGRSVRVEDGADDVPARLQALITAVLRLLAG